MRQREMVGVGWGGWRARAEVETNGPYIMPKNKRTCSLLRNKQVIQLPLHVLRHILLAFHFLSLAFFTRSK